jgi:hypothetical protein
LLEPHGTNHRLEREKRKRETREQMLRQGTQGNLHYRNFDPRRWCQGATHPHQELDLDYFLRGRRHLRRHHEHRVLCQARTGQRRCRILWKQLLHWIRPLLERHACGHVQLDLRRQCWHQRLQRCVGRRRGPFAVSSGYGWQLNPKVGSDTFTVSSRFWLLRSSHLFSDCSD